MDTPSIKVFKDGTSWVAVLPDFINLQESNAWFGDDPQEAIENLMSSTEAETIGYYFE